MRRFLLVISCIAISFSASAQWYKLRIYARPEFALEQAQVHNPTNFLTAYTPPRPRLKSYSLSRTAYVLEASQQAVMKTAQHNMRFRIYDAASYNFSELADLYVAQNRYSEAKWYFLQSTNISRQQNNYKLTLANLGKLALVKAEIGDYALAMQDLREARDIATYQGLLIDLIEVEKKINLIQRNRMIALLSDKRYADELAAEN